jgi:hypothetical protein
MKRIYLVLIACLAIAGSQAQSVNDPNVQVREAKGFHAVSFSSAFDVYLTQGDEEKVAVSAANEKYLEYIIVEVRNGVLEIGWNHRNGKWGRGNKKLKAYVSFKTIDRLKASGACDVKIVGTLKATELAVELSGASDLRGNVEANKLSVELSGASDGKLSGSVSRLDIEASGASAFKSFDLGSDICNARASGASDVWITVNKEMSAEASGASAIRYKGTATTKDIKASGASKVSHS